MITAQQSYQFFNGFPRSIREQLARDFIRLILAQSMCKQGITFSDIRECLMESPAGRWCVHHSSGLLPSYETRDLAVVLPEYLLDLMISFDLVDHTSKYGLYVTKVGEDLLTQWADLKGDIKGSMFLEYMGIDG